MTCREKLRRWIHEGRMCASGGMRIASQAKEDNEERMARIKAQRDRHRAKQDAGAEDKHLNGVTVEELQNSFMMCLPEIVEMKKRFHVLAPATSNKESNSTKVDMSGP